MSGMTTCEWCDRYGQDIDAEEINSALAWRTPWGVVVIEFRRDDGCEFITLCRQCKELALKRVIHLIQTGGGPHHLDTISVRPPLPAEAKGRE